MLRKLLLILPVLLAHNFAFAAVDISWLAYAQLSSENIQFDANCPGNRMEGLNIETHDQHLVINIQRLLLDLDCPSAPQSGSGARPDLSPILASLPDSNFRIKSVILDSHKLNKPIGFSLWGYKRNQELRFDIKGAGQQGWVRLTGSSNKLEFSLDSQIEPLMEYIPGLPERLTGTGKLFYRSKLSRPFTGTGKLHWTGALDGVSKGSLNLTGLADLTNLQLSQITGGLNLARVKSGDLELAELALDILPGASISAGSSYLPFILRPQEFQYQGQVFPQASLSGEIKGQSNQFTMDWRLEMAGLTLPGSLDYKGNKLRFDSRAEDLELNPLALELAQTIRPLKGFSLNDGKLTYRLSGAQDIALNKGSFELELTAETLTGLYKDIFFENGQLQLQLAYHMEQNRLTTLKDNNTFKLELLDLGIPLTSLEGGFRVNAGQIELSSFKTRVLGGTAEVGRFRLAQGGQGAVKITGLGLANLISYSQLPSLKGEGVIDGLIPLSWQQDGIRIKQGKVKARQPGGWIRLPQTPEIQALGASNMMLDFTLKVLEELDFSKLEGIVDYEPDGEMALKVTLEGRSPAVSETRPVVLNYSHSENMLQLLRSLRFSKELERSIEEKSGK